jgi:cytochrome c oxidase subunit 4
MATDSIKLYGVIYVALMILAASKWILFHNPYMGYWDAVLATLGLALTKSFLIVSYFQHLKWENRSLSYLVVLTLGLVMLLMSAATYSIT